jgi:chromosome segregation ATPase
LPALLQEASRAADADAITTHRRRLQEIDLFINAANVRVLRLQIARDEERLRAAEQNLAEVTPFVEPAQTRVREAQAQLNDALNQVAWAQSTLYDLRQSVVERRHRIDGLMNQLDKAA